jgi:predicted small metal-binding protein
MHDRETADTVTVRCVCGWEVRGSEEEVVAATSEHGKRLHNMSATREQILAMAVRPGPAGSAATPGDAPS